MLPILLQNVLNYISLKTSRKSKKVSNNSTSQVMYWFQIYNYFWEPTSLRRVFAPNLMGCSFIYKMCGAPKQNIILCCENRLWANWVEDHGSTINLVHGWRWSTIEEAVKRHSGCDCRGCDYTLNEIRDLKKHNSAANNVTITLASVL